MAASPSLDLAALATAYFATWNKQDVPGLRVLLDDACTLRDWDIEKKGGDAVAEANGGIFAAVPKIEIEVLKLHVAEATRSVSAEILVKLNDEAGEVLKVVDVIEFTEGGKVSAVRAYKG